MIYIKIFNFPTTTNRTRLLISALKFNYGSDWVCEFCCWCGVFVHSCSLVFVCINLLMKQGSGFFVYLHNCIKLHFHHHFSYLYCILEVVVFSQLKKPLSLSRHTTLDDPRRPDTSGRQSLINQNTRTKHLFFFFFYVRTIKLKLQKHPDIQLEKLEEK